jgi:hypothetical protein
MNPIKIRYFLSIGHRCNSTDFAIKYDLRKFSSPFDYMYVDFESALQIISKRFSDFCNDIVIMDNQNKSLQLIHKKNTNVPDEEYSMLLKKNIKYMNDDFSWTTLRINQTYTRPFDHNEEILDNIYFWPRICIHHHHNVQDIHVLNGMQKRCNRFLKVVDNYWRNAVLFYITQILHSVCIEDEIFRLITMKNKYNVKSFLIYILCCDDHDDDHFFIDRCLFIVKKVPSYRQQFLERGTDNHVKYLNYDREIDLMRKYFDMDLIEKDALDLE